MGEQEGSEYGYQIDAGDRISEVSDAWLAFARENDAPALTREAVVGRPLWDFIAGPQTRELYRAVLARVREANVPVSLPFRCDSPNYRRWMRLQVTPQPNGDVRFEGRLLRKRERVNLGILDPQARRSPRELPMCSCCKRVELEHEWLEPEDAIARLHDLGAEPYPRLAQVVCGDCHALAERSIAGVQG